MENSFLRARIATFRELVANHKKEDQRGVFKVTPYKIIQYGLVPDEYKDEYQAVLEDKLKEKPIDSTLTLQEQLSYSTFFVQNPEKVCGVMLPSTSGGFAVKVKGTRADVEAAINKTLQKQTLSVEQRIRVALALAKARSKARLKNA